MRGVSFMRVIARLKPGSSITQAQAAMPALVQSYREQPESEEEVLVAEQAAAVVLAQEPWE